LIISPTLHTAGIAGLETAINAALTLDPATSRKLATLNGHSFELHCAMPDVNFFLIPGESEVRLCGLLEGKADTTLTGSFDELLKLALSKDPANTLINGELELHGDSNALIELQKTIKGLDLDWEAPLSKLFGDVAAHEIGRGIRKGLKFARQGLQKLQRQGKEFLVEESELFPPRWQVDNFYRDIEQLSQRAERLEARLQRLAQRRRAK
jgi:ubiquinone biosynthesis protein UbiJ